MVRQYDAQIMCDIALRKYKPLTSEDDSDQTKSFWDQGWRTNFTKTDKYIACCDHTNKRIIISVPALNARSEAELMETIMHEMAHAIVGHGHGHDDVWKAKAVELGAKPVSCAPVNFDAGRSIAIAETKKPSKIKSIQKYCPTCYATAVVAAQMEMGGTIWMKLECGHLVSKESLPDPLEGLESWTSTSGKQLFPFQIEGIKFVGNAQGRALIADEPGLGKTAQAFGCLKFFPEIRPALWVSKSTLKLQTVKEGIDWGGPEMMGQIIEHGKTFIIPGLNLYVVSMDLLRNIPTEKLEEIPFKTIIADEIQHFKNPDSTRTGELRKLVSRAEYFIPLSGTPWKNRGSEYFPVLNMLRPEIFDSFKRFKNQWIDYYFDKESGKYREGGIRNIPAFRNLTKDFIIRRMRDDVLPDLPKINRQLRFVDMEDEYTKLYDRAESKLANMLKAALIEGVSPKNIAAMIMELKHYTGLAKVKSGIDDCIEWLDNVPDDFEKLTIFHHHIDVGDLLQMGVADYPGIDEWLVNHGYNKSLRLLGGKGPEERQYIIDQFKLDPKNRVLIASTLASGEGLNIQFCQNAYMMERQWNPQNEEQAELRFSRPLSKSDLPEYLYPIADRKVSIRIPYFIAAGTVDEILTNIIEKKRLAFRKSMNVKDENITWDEAELIHEVAEAIIKKRFKK